MLTALPGQPRSYATFLVAALILVLLWAVAPRSAADLSRFTHVPEQHGQQQNEAPSFSDVKPPEGTTTAATPEINHQVSHADVATSDRVAVIIESRPLSNLLPMILHFSSVLGPAWPIILYYTDDSLPYSPAMKRALDSGALTVRKLPDDGTVKFDSHRSVSAFLISPWLWRRLAPARHVLLFQTDSVLCANSPRRVDDFLEWDLIGAPIDKKYGAGYNGGLSLRNRELMLRIAEGRDEEADHPAFEDQWFYAKAKELADKGEDVKLPGVEEASKFSVETIWADRPLGYHQISRWHKGRMDEVKEWCPEIDMAIGGSLHPGHA